MRATLGVLVAGGRGRRLSLGVPKALVEVGGRTLLERALETLGEVCGEVVVVAPPAMELPVARAARVDDALDHAGPLAGLVAGLEARPAPAALVLGVDFPWMAAATLRAILDRLEENDLAVVPAPEGIPQPLAAAYAAAAGPALRAALEAGERAVTRAVLALPARLLGADEVSRLPGGAASFFNLNTPDDLERARRGRPAPAGEGRDSRSVA